MHGLAERVGPSRVKGNLGVIWGNLFHIAPMIALFRSACKVFLSEKQITARAPQWRGMKIPRNVLCLVVWKRGRPAGGPPEGKYFVVIFRADPYLEERGYFAIARLNRKEPSGERTRKATGHKRRANDVAGKVLVARTGFRGEKELGYSLL